ncbi:MAG: dephospho-CoA kinase [Phycisphaerae bacterium]|nr:dephospho-CoA kinase [Phycisphaerae bacterium]
MFAKSKGSNAFVQPIIGLAGGIGSGKSTVARWFAELGAAVLASDEINREELNSPEVLTTLRQWWGDAVIDGQGMANRDAIRAIVREDEAARQRLERLMHPRIADRQRVLMQQWRKDPQIRAIIWDSPLLFEAGLAEKCDWIVFVDADGATRRERVERSRGWGPNDWDRLEKAQKPLDFKKERAHYIVDNNSDIDAVRRQVESIFSRILAASKPLAD